MGECGPSSDTIHKNQRGSPRGEREKPVTRQQARADSDDDFLPNPTVEKKPAAAVLGEDEAPRTKLEHLIEEKINAVTTFFNDLCAYCRNDGYDNPKVVTECGHIYCTGMLS